MADAPSYLDLAQAAGIAPSYAHQIVNGVRDPSPTLALRIYDTTGWKAPKFAPLTREQIAVFAGLSRPTPEQTSAAA